MKTSESDKKKTFTEEITGTASEIIKQVKRLIKEGNARRVMIKDKKGKILFQSQMTVGLGGAAVVAAVAPVISAISMFLLFMNDVKIVVEKYPDEETGEDEFEVEADAEVIEVEDEEEGAEATDENGSGENENNSSN